jgi:hypothetical protein
MNLHHCCEQAVIPELRLFAQRAEQYPPITRLALINARISAFTWSLEEAFTPRGNNTPNFLGLICFHSLDELWIITADDALPDTFEEECRASLTNMFEWEKKRGTSSQPQACRRHRGESDESPTSYLLTRHPSQPASRP